MSAEKVIFALLSSSPTLAALIGDRIHSGSIPQAETLPAVAYSHISTVGRATAALKAGQATSRIQVTIAAREYPAKKKVLAAVVEACALKQGAIAGVAVSSVIRDTVGPDFEDPETEIEFQTVDFRVTYQE